MSSLSKADILGADEEIIEVDMPEWGGCVHLKQLSGADEEVYQKKSAQRITKDSSGKEDVNVTNWRSEFLVMCLCDPSGDLMFDRDSMGALNGKSAKSIQRLYDIAMGKCGTLDLEEAEKN